MSLYNYYLLRLKMIQPPRTFQHPCIQCTTMHAYRHSDLNFKLVSIL